MDLPFKWNELRCNPVFRDVRPWVLTSFWRYHENNPNIWRLFEQFTKEARAAGLQRYGVAAIFERVRWHVTVEHRVAGFKMNNNYRSCYARLITLISPDLGKLFETRGKKRF
jgi:hypothetical protein